jgi:hypothetical protein
MTIIGAAAGSIITGEMPFGNSVHGHFPPRLPPTEDSGTSPRRQDRSAILSDHFILELHFEDTTARAEPNSISGRSIATGGHADGGDDQTFLQLGLLSV